MKLLSVGGGSGGHVTPVLAVINELASRDPGLEVTFVCDKGFLEQSRGIMAHATVPVVVKTITAGKLRRYAHMSRLRQLLTPSIVGKNIIDSFKIGIGFVQSVALLRREKPDVIFAKGGFVCLPLGAAAHMLRVENRGCKRNSPYDICKTANGHAKIPDPTQPGKLKVSFFLSFYSDYYVLELDEENYNYALVGSSTDKYLWILSRTPQLPEEIKKKLVTAAERRGYDTSQLKWIEQL
jgi:hypothetical protein